MKIWVDADACPRPIKEVLFRAALKRKIAVILVANKLIQAPAYIKRVVVQSSFDAADNYILANLMCNDLIITADILLADEVISKGAMALNPRGELYSTANIKHFLSQRNLNESLRSSGIINSNLGQFSKKEVALFSNHLDRIITRHANDA